MFLALGTRSSREISRFGDPPSFSVGFVNIICLAIEANSEFEQAFHIEFYVSRLGEQSEYRTLAGIP